MNIPVRDLMQRYNTMTYKDIYEFDSRPVPQHLRVDAVPDIGTDPVKARNYICPDFYQKEVDRLWTQVWQVACREEDIPSVGSYVVYEIANQSWLIVRTAPDQIKALQNVCLHRGRKLATQAGCTKKFTCMFHGIAWNTQGELVDNPLKDDFPHWQGKTMNLREAHVGTWGGFVFINMAENPQPLAEAIKPLPEHFADYHTDDMYTAVHVAKKFPCNWKITAEAFMESHHAVVTHPQLSPFLNDIHSKYDILSPLVSRQFSAMGIPGTFVDTSKMTETDILNAMLNSSGRTEQPKERAGVPEGMTARAFAADMQRKALAAEDGYDYSQKSDAEMLDALLYNVFPNFSVWAGYALKLVYLWRPVDVDNSIMEVRVLKRIPKGQVRPKPAAVQWIEAETPCATVAELGVLGGVFDQDMVNLPHVQAGLKAGGNDFPVHFTKYTEMRLRLLHQTIEKLIGV